MREIGGPVGLNVLEIGIWGIYLSSSIIGLSVGLHDWIKRDTPKSSLNMKKVVGGSTFLLSLPLLFWFMRISPLINIIDELLFSLLVGLIVSLVATAGMILWFSESN